MTKTITISREAFSVALADLADVCKLAQSMTARDERINAVIGSACTAVANMLAGCGSYGGHAQVAAMDLARAAGFEASFYPGTIRVVYVGG